MKESYKTLRKKEYRKRAFQDLQAEAFCDLLEVVLPNSKLPKKVREFKGVIQIIKNTYPNPDYPIVDITRRGNVFKAMFNFIKGVF